jgi:hypothetical protein
VYVKALLMHGIVSPAIEAIPAGVAGLVNINVLEELMEQGEVTALTIMVSLT